MARPISAIPGRSRLTSISTSISPIHGSNRRAGRAGRSKSGRSPACSCSTTKALVDGALKQLDLPVTALYSTLGRTAARAIETKIIADTMDVWFANLMANIKSGDLKTFNETKWEPRSWPSEARGVGYMEAPRGALGHWIVIKNGKIANYQAVVPSTWNAGPRDGRGQEGPYEAALKGHVLQNPAQPIEILRTIHSFDPCIACAVHVVDPAGEELIRVKIR